MLRLRQLTIRKYRDCEPCELKFGPGQVFLLGMNGGGKTTLVELLSRLAAADLSALEGETKPVDIEWLVEGDLAPGQTTRLTTTVWTAPGPPSLFPDRYPPLRWSVRLKVERDNDELVDVEVRNGQTQVLSLPSLALPEGDPPIAFAHAMGEVLTRLAEASPSDHPCRSLLEDGAALVDREWFGRIDEALDRFTALTAPPIDQPTMPMAPIISAIGGRARAHFVPPSAVPTPTRAAHRPVLASHLGGRWPFVASDVPPGQIYPEALNDMLGAVVECAPRLQSASAAGAKLYRGFDFLLTWSDGTQQRHDALSFGQKRLLAATWFLACERIAPVFTDELSNGLHAAWITRLLELLGDQQAFHATQNPLLLDLAGPGPADELASRFVRCEVALVEGKRRWRWRNPTDEEAARINAGYEAGFQHLSDILQSEGLW